MTNVGATSGDDTLTQFRSGHGPKALSVGNRAPETTEALTETPALGHPPFGPNGMPGEGAVVLVRVG